MERPRRSLTDEQGPSDSSFPNKRAPCGLSPNKEVRSIKGVFPIKSEGRLATRISRIPPKEELPRERAAKERNRGKARLMKVVMIKQRNDMVSTTIKRLARWLKQMKDMGEQSCGGHFTPKRNHKNHRLLIIRERRLQPIFVKD
eukprot:scaffold1667_cov173-Amphora_coffeaeformis.AAC.25